MPNIVLLGHICTGHAAYPPRPNIQGSPNFFVKNLPVHRQGDSWDIHCRTVIPFDCHGGVLSVGTSNFLANGRPVAKVGDPISCGSFCQQGEPSFIIGS
jgi:uncharacterized Zn-binding protein involved in type VI secretion